MSDCAITPITTNKACSGKCKSGGCHDTPRVWIVAACEGMISLFEKDTKGTLAPMLQHGNAVFASLDAFQKSIDTAEHTHAFDQLVIIGSSSDIAWIHASLSAPATRHIVAEIEYPLMSSWFKELGLAQLINALKNLLLA